MKKEDINIQALRDFLSDDAIQDELSLFDVVLTPDMSDEELITNYMKALEELPAEFAKGLQKLNSELSDVVKAADIDAATAMETGRISMTDRALIIKTCQEAFFRGMESLRKVASDLTDAIVAYQKDPREPLAKTDKFEAIQEANKLLADQWQQTVETSRRLGLREFRRLTGGENSQEIEQLKSIVSAKFTIDPEIARPMHDYANVVTEYQKAKRIQIDAEINAAQDMDRSFSQAPER